MKADLLDSIGDVRAGEGQVLKGASQTPGVRSICSREEITFTSGQLGVGVNRCLTGLAVSHSCTVQDLYHELVLREQHTITRALNPHPKEMV